MLALLKQPKMLAKHLLKPLIYRYPPMMIQPERLYLWLDSIIKTKDIDGAIVEVGCFLGGTSAFSNRMVERLKFEKDYIAIDTFSGFQEDQWKVEKDLGTSEQLRDHFSDNSPRLTRWILDRHGGKSVKIVQGDITKVPDDRLPERISACLLDVDLADPIEKGLERLLPRLQSGGIILVDDCGWPTYAARVGYSNFCKKAGIAEEYLFGMGIIRRQTLGSS